LGARQVRIYVGEPLEELRSRYSDFLSDGGYGWTKRVNASVERWLSAQDAILARLRDELGAAVLVDACDGRGLPRALCGEEQEAMDELRDQARASGIESLREAAQGILEEIE
jgi:hypothetical protein